MTNEDMIIYVCLYAVILCILIFGLVLRNDYNKRKYKDEAEIYKEIVKNNIFNNIEVTSENFCLKIKRNKPQQDT